jgi:hypothetical protein
LGLDARQASGGLRLQTISLVARAFDPADTLFAHPQIGLPQPLGQDEGQDEEQPQHDKHGVVDVEELGFPGLRRGSVVGGDFE